MPYDWTVIPSFGGGLNVSAHPAAIEPTQWSWANGFIARNGYAEMMLPHSALTAAIGAAGDQIIGMVQNPFTGDGAYVATVDASNNIKMYKVNGAGTVTALNGGASPGKGLQTAVLQSGVLGGKVFFTFGAYQGINGCTVYFDSSEIFTVTGGAFDHCTSFASHLVTAVGPTSGVPFTLGVNEERFVSWSAANDVTTFTPAVSNDADNVVLDDATAGIGGIQASGDNLLAVFSRDTVHALVPTGGIPAYTRQILIRGLGALQVRAADYATTNLRESFIGGTPRGPIFASWNNIHLLQGGSATPIGNAIYPYWVNLVGLNTFDYCRPFVWHDRYNAAVLPIPDGTGGNTVALYWNPDEQVWSRAALGSARILRLAYIYSIQSSTMVGSLWAATTSRTILQDFPASSFTGGFVDTKDFALGDAPDDMIDRVRVDWEPITNSGTDAIDVQVYARNDLSPAILGAAGGVEDFSAQFTTLGTLTAGATELALSRTQMIRARYARFRFKKNSGLVRIRGFAFRRRHGSDLGQ